MREPFIGSEALQQGQLTRHELQRWYRRLLPDVYVSKRRIVTVRDRTEAAWLWSTRRGVIAGVTASALYGASWVDVTDPVEVVLPSGKPPSGLIVRHDALAPAEVTKVAGLPVTTPARTAFDLGRCLPRDEAIARLDALVWTVPSALHDIESVVDRHPGARGMKKLRAALPLVDGGAESPKETWLRLLFVDAGLPMPQTQIPLYDGRRLIRKLDMGWEEYEVGAEYDGDQHRTDRRSYVKDIKVKRRFGALHWKVLSVIKEDHPDEIVDWARRSLTARGWRA